MYVVEHTIILVKLYNHYLYSKDHKQCKQQLCKMCHGRQPQHTACECKLTPRLELIQLIIFFLLLLLFWSVAFSMYVCVVLLLFLSLFFVLVGLVISYD